MKTSTSILILTLTLTPLLALSQHYENEGLDRASLKQTCSESQITLDVKGVLEIQYSETKTVRYFFYDETGTCTVVEEVIAYSPNLNVNTYMEEMGFKLHLKLSDYNFVYKKGEVLKTFVAFDPEKEVVYVRYQKLKPTSETE